MAPLSYPATHLSHLFQPGSVQQLHFLSWGANKHFVPAASKSNPSIRLWTFLGNCSRWGSAWCQGGPLRVVAHYRWLPKYPPSVPREAMNAHTLDIFPASLSFFWSDLQAQFIPHRSINWLKIHSYIRNETCQIFFTTNILIRLVHIGW